MVPSITGHSPGCPAPITVSATQVSPAPQCPSSNNSSGPGNKACGLGSPLEPWEHSLTPSKPGEFSHQTSSPSKVTSCAGRKTQAGEWQHGSKEAQEWHLAAGLWGAWAFPPCPTRASPTWLYNPRPTDSLQGVAKGIAEESPRGKGAVTLLQPAAVALWSRCPHSPTAATAATWGRKQGGRTFPHFPTGPRRTDTSGACQDGRATVTSLG